jgi:ComF family protein
MVYGWSKRILDLIYPPHCILCGDHGHADLDLCPACLADLPHNRLCCTVCALPLAGPDTQALICGQCQRKPPAFDHCLAPFRYEGRVRELITGFKFRGSLATGRLLSNLLGDFLTRQDLELPDALIPVPLHTARLRQRGYNQALELARPVARRLGVPLRPTACRRARPTPPQSGLDQRERRRNLRGAFELAGPIRADHWVILDDVVTTGSTVGELARLLKRAGAQRVDVWALARRP